MASFKAVPGLIDEKNTLSIQSVRDLNRYIIVENGYLRLRTNNDSLEFKKAAGVYARIGLSLNINYLDVVFDKDKATKETSGNMSSIESRTFVNSDTVQFNFTYNAHPDVSTYATLSR